MRKYVGIAFISFIIGFVSSGLIFAQLEFIEPTSPNATQNVSEVIVDIDGNPLRQWTYLPVQSPDWTEQIWIINQWEIQTYEQGQLQTLQYIKNIINYFLGFLAAIALILLMYAGFKVVIAWTDDEKYKDAVSTFRKVALAILWIGLSWFIVTMVFYVVWLIVSF